LRKNISSPLPILTRRFKNSHKSLLSNHFSGQALYLADEDESADEDREPAASRELEAIRRDEREVD